MITYTFSTFGNGLAINIQDSMGGEVALLQGDEAAQLIDALEMCESGDEQQEMLGAYDMRSEVMA